jgi:hypothetical protein
VTVATRRTLGWDSMGSWSYNPLRLREARAPLK